MILYTVTILLDRAVEADWLSWMRTVHVPDVLATGWFRSGRVFRVLDPAPEAGRVAYSIQYECSSREEYEAYWAADAPRLQQEHMSRYAGRFTAARAVLEGVETRARNREE
jgi:hypothetical protein